jgi:DNA-directed RNA polymerase specialized sigma24 family protein
VGEGADFSEYVSSRWAALVRSARLLGADPHEAEDLVQSALARCYVSWSKVRAADVPDAYVYRVLVNVYRDSRRRHWRRERPTDRLPDRPDERDAVAAVDDAGR